MRNAFFTLSAVLVFLIGFTTKVAAQDTVFVQIEAQPSLTAAQDRARDYAGNLSDVNGFYLGSGWYGISLGPYTPDDAAYVLRELRRNGSIPSDSFIIEAARLRQQFWPIGANTLASPTPAAPNTGTDTAEVEVAETPDEPPVVIEPVQEPDETLRQARASEALLTRDEKKELQIAMRWAGTYAAAIDGSYGRGTRNAMALWQEQNNFEVTGVLTIKQRAALLQSYNAILDGMEMQAVLDEAAGIQIEIPLGVVAFDKFDPPFVQYNATGDIGAQVLLISQAGDANTLLGLYDIMETLEIVPLGGPRERGKNSFTLTGVNDDIHTEIFAELRNGQVKGFGLVWPAGDDARRTRVFDEMKASFQRTDGVLDPALGEFEDNQAIDLVSGLALRKPLISRSGFYVDTAGSVVTSSDVVSACTRITLDTDTEGTVTSIDETLGLALITPKTATAPIGVARFQMATPRLQSDVAVAGYPYEGILGAPSVTFGKLADIRGLRGETELKRLALYAQPGDAGGPVLDSGGAVLGKLLPKVSVNGQTLPQEVSFAVNSENITAFLDLNGVSAQTVDQISYMAPEDMTTLAANFTVLVSCWD